MTKALRRFAVILVMFGLAGGLVFSQSTPSAGGFAFKMDMGIGVQNFSGSVEPGTFQSIGLSPDISFGSFGIGLALTINYNFTSGTGGSLYIRQADWVPTDFQSFLAIYLPKISYIRWGEKGDPLFLKFGSFKDATLGDGFIMGEYDNTLFLPADRHFGFQADLDGGLFNFPFVGLETVVGNVARLDVLGGRAYVRPLISTSIPIFNNLEVGFTGVVDTQPALYGTTVAPAAPVAVLGGDILLPIVYLKDVFSLAAFTDVASIQGKSWGGMLGFGGRIINFITYGAQLRVLGSGFTPVYFGPSYDLTRNTQFDDVQTASGTGSTVGASVSAGTSLLDDKIVFRVSLDAPFYSTETDPRLYLPHLRGIVSLAEGVVPGITFDFSYDKAAIATWGDLVSPQDAIIKAQLNFKTGGAVISFVYSIVYNPPPAAEPWTVTSGLQSSISLF